MHHFIYHNAQCTGHENTCDQRPYLFIRILRKEGRKEQLMDNYVEESERSFGCKVNTQKYRSFLQSLYERMFFCVAHLLHLYIFHLIR
jgi:hypothetical protein